MIYLGSDHAGFSAKESIADKLTELGYDFLDLGPSKENSTDDYPVFAFSVAKKISEDSVNRGILICGSANGMAIAANKVKGARAVVAWDRYSAQKSREDNNANILCLSARDIDLNQNFLILEIWLKTDFSQLERHQKRLEIILEYEEKYLKQ